MHESGEPLPFDLQGAAVYHCGPIMSKDGDGWKLVAAGPTTSSRMNSIEPAFIRAFGVRVLIGKGGMSKPTVEAMKKCGCVYLAFTGGAAVIAAQGIETVLTPYRAPNANACAERWVRSVREECLDHLLILNQAHLRCVLREYVDYYDTARPHQGLDQQAPIPFPRGSSTGPISRRDVLGGILHDYRRQAA